MNAMEKIMDVNKMDAEKRYVGMKKNREGSKIEPKWIEY